MKPVGTGTLRLHWDDFSDRLAAGGLRKQPAGGCGNQAAEGLKKGSESTFHCALLAPFTVTSRHFRDARINQRIDSLPCPALFSMFPGRLARFLDGRGFHQTTTIGLRRLELRLDYAWAGGEGPEAEVGCG
jgi:hypothetical protein